LVFTRALLVNAVLILAIQCPPGATFSPSLFQTREVPTSAEEFNPFDLLALETERIEHRLGNHVRG
jgi:hypothetical protein